MFLKPLLLIDIDGTYYDGFIKDDKKIIKEIFFNNRFINFIDSIAWFINSFDLISNSFNILKFRLKIYSLLTGKNYLNILESYKILYEKNFFNNIKEKNEGIEKIQKMYKIIFISANPYAVAIINNQGYKCYRVKNIVDRVALYDMLRYYYYGCILAIVGNNYVDDIWIAKKFGYKSVYIGKSIIIDLLKKDYKYKSFKEFVKQARILYP